MVAPCVSDQRVKALHQIRSPLLPTPAGHGYCLGRSCIASVNSLVPFAAGCLLTLCGGGAYASSMEPIELGKSTAPADTAVTAEQSHLQHSSVQMRSAAIREGDLPLEFKKSAGPRGHNLINLSF